VVFYRESAPPPGSPPPVITSPQLNRFAVVAIFVAVFFPIGGLVFGHVALAQIKRTGEQGRGMARMALVLGYISLGGIVLIGLTILASIAAQSS
jgi:hypothetical protein